MKNKKIMTVLTFLGLYLFSAGSSWALFAYLKADPVTAIREGGEGSKLGEGLPKTEECPINGKLYSVPEREVWEQRRPITAIIENHLESRPQSGLSSADVIYEAVAEGGITRFLSVFYCGVAEDVRVAPIRSVRVYFVHWAAEYGDKPIFVHIGGANNICKNCPGGVKEAGMIVREADAFRLLTSIGWRYALGNSFDGGTNIGYPIIIRDQYRLGKESAWEHSVTGFTEKIYQEADKRGFAATSNGELWSDGFTKWKFTDDKPAANPSAPKISFKFWNGKPEYDVGFDYDRETNSYFRVNGGQPHKDHETGEQIAVKNVIIKFVEEKGPVDKEDHLLYTTEGTGKAIVFQNGEAVEGTWQKRAMSGRTLFYDSSGREINLVRGMIWIAAVPDTNTISY
jgi:hypothetical protein